MRAICTLVTVCLLSGTGLAQSVLNFTPRGPAGIAITNPTAYAADVKFTLYNADGSLATTDVLNPVSKRIPAKNQISVFSTDIFRMKEGARQDTWIQASSSVAGLQGFYFSGDFVNTLDGAEASEPQTLQWIPYIPAGDPRMATFIVVTNPGSQAASVTINYYDAVGGASGPPQSFRLEAHAQQVLPGRGLSARISSDAGVLVTAVEDSRDSLVLINGQGPKAQAQRFVAPYFNNSENVSSFLVLVNPGTADADVTVSFFTDFGAQPTAVTATVRANGSSWLDWRSITHMLIPNPGDGWLLVESTAPMAGLVLVTSGGGQTAVPLQPAPSDRLLLSRFVDGGVFQSTLTLVGNTEREAVVTVALSRPDGTTIAKRDVTIPPLFRWSGKIRELIPIPDTFSNGFITVQSSTPVFGLELLDADEGGSEAAVTPQKLPSGYQTSSIVGLPRILSVIPVIDPIDGTRRINIVGQNIESNATLYVGGKIVPMSPTSPIGGRYSADLPALEPGYVNVKVRVAGLDSNIISLGVFPDDAVFIPRSGQALYQKWELTESGFDPARTVLVPIRNARVEVLDRVTQQVVSVAETDEQGVFLIGVPDRSGLTVRVLSRLRSTDVKVLDNTSGNKPYVLAKDIDDPGSTEEIELIDTARQAGAFNILDDVQRGNTLVAQADPQLVPPPLTIFWSEKNNESVLSRLTGGQFKSTFFNLATNTAYILGDRNTDSDEFDDSVILHEYAHMLAARFSRDDSPGGPHVLGDILDPRLAWSEGWANFFSSAARGSSIYLDSKGPGVPMVRYDLEDNVPPNDRPGYWSEASVDGLLWDLLDENADRDDLAQFPFAAIWNAFTDLRNVRFVYLPYFLESFLSRNPGFSDALRTMVVARSIDFQPEVRPSVVNPFPKPIGIGVAGSRTGEVDSFTSKRTNLAISSHFYAFTTTGGTATITLNIEGLGPANNPNANDLDLFLYDGNGKRLELSDRNLNGQPELISGIRLNPGTYYVEVRSFYTRAETNTMVFNSGNYRLTVLMQ